jgi:hypothetical protein
MQRLAYSFVVQFAWLRPGALRHIVVAHPQRGQIADSARAAIALDASCSACITPGSELMLLAACEPDCGIMRSRSLGRAPPSGS